MFLHTYIPHPIAFFIGSLPIHWYGIFLALGVLAGYALLRPVARMQHVFSREQLESLYIQLLLWGFVGARIYLALNNPGFYSEHPYEIIAIWRGGLAIHGALFAGLLVLLFHARTRRASFLRLADIFVIPLALGQSIGRWGNYFNQELFGKPTDAWWGIPIAPENRVQAYASYTHFHPAFLYESILAALLCVMLIVVYKKTPQRGTVFALYLILYSLARIAMELVRIDQGATVLGVRLPLVVSVMLLIVGSMVISMIALHRRSTLG